MALNGARVLLACLALGLAQPALAGDWQADGSSGRLAFTATLAGGRFEGQFRRYTVRLGIADGRPAVELVVEVMLGSASTANAVRDAVLKGPEFFWTERHPVARYHASTFQRVGDHWVAGGSLGLRGVTRPLPVRFKLSPDGAGWRLAGTVRLRRLEFGVGQGEWASTEWLADEVEVAFDLSLQAVPAASP